MRHGRRPGGGKEGGSRATACANCLFLLLPSVLLLSCRLDLSFEMRDGRADPAAEDMDGVEADTEAGPDDGIPGDDGPAPDTVELTDCGNGSVDTGEECDDGNAVPGDGCEPGTCRYSCHGDGECDDGDICNGNEICDRVGTHACAPGVNAGAGTPCLDGADCTRDDACDGNGLCVGVRDDSRCSGGEVCNPACFESSDGCGVPPSSLVMSCESPVDPSAASTCTVSLDSVSGQSGCISCDARFGMIMLGYTDFGERAGVCDLGGWTLATGLHCTDDYDAATCEETGSTIECCSEFASICQVRPDKYILRSNKGTNCGGGFEEWRLSRTFDTMGLENLMFDMASGFSPGTVEDFLIVKVSDASHSENLLCTTSDALRRSTGLRGPGNFILHTLALPSWADDNGAVTITITANSNAAGDVFTVDSVSLSGWPAGCASSRQTVFAEDFSGCPDPIMDGWKGWEVTGEPSCPGFTCTGGEGDGLGAQALTGEWTMERTVDTSSLDGGVRICFDVGDAGSNAGESVQAWFSTDGGSAWHAIWYQSQEINVDGTCTNVCVDLSGIDGAAARNPAMKIRFTLAANDRAVTIDDISLSGAVFCPAGGDLVLDVVSETSTPGTYEFSVHDGSGDQMTALPSCFWDEAAEPVSGWDDISFMISP